LLKFLVDLLAIVAFNEKEFLRYSQRGQVEKKEKLQKFSARLRSARVRSGIGQEEMAKMLNVSKGAVGNWENASNYPTPAKLRKIAEILSQPISYFFDGDQDDRVLPTETGIEEEARAACHRHIDSVIDACKGDVHQVIWTLVELKKRFPVGDSVKDPVEEVGRKTLEMALHLKGAEIGQISTPPQDKPQVAAVPPETSGQPMPPTPDKPK
jgi:transcriptional regulator with XRE-family HTH domain